MCLLIWCFISNHILLLLLLFLIGISKSTQILDMIKKYNMDILSLNETNLNDTIATQTLNIPVNYTFLRNDRGTGSRGGCGLIISNKLAYDRPPDTMDQACLLRQVFRHVFGILGRFWISHA